VASIVDQEADADLILRSATYVIPPGAIADVAALPEVGQADVVGFAPVTVDGTGSNLIGLTPGTFGRSIKVRTIDGDLGSLADGEIAVQKSRAEDDGLAVGDTLDLAADGGTRTLTIGAIFESNALGAPYVVDQPVLDEIVPATDQSVDTVFVNAAAGSTVADAQQAVSDAVAPYVVVSVQDKDEWVSDMADQVNQVLVILYALLGLSVVIAVLGIVNTLALSVIERTREIGLLRAVGLGRLQLSGTVTIESVLTAVFGTVVGLVVGVALASALPRVYADDGLSSLVIPWGSLIGMLVLAVVVGVLAALWPAGRAARMKVLDAVSYE
jgi:putative ABC transport system permease protein